MENHRGSLPNNSSNSLNSSQNERRGMVNTNGGYLGPPGSTLSAPPGFGGPSSLSSSTSSMQPNFQSMQSGGHGLRHQNIYPFDKPYGIEDYNLQSGYGYSPFYPSASSHAYPTEEFLQTSSYSNVQQVDHSESTNGFDLNSGFNVLLRTKNGHSVAYGGNINHPNSCSINGQANNNENGVIKPIIDNIVGSMGMWNGTYTHFGPVEPSSPRFSSEIPQHYLRPEPKQADQAPLVLDNFVQSSASGDFVTGKESPVSGAGVRSGTPNNDSGSRPHTPGKPSYSEILAKNAAQVNAGACGSKSLPLSSQPSVNCNNSKPPSGQGQVKEGVSSSGILSFHHRKSVDSNVSSNSSATSSLCTSASSSPVAKQKNAQSIVGRFFNPTKGKENAESSNKSGSNKGTKGNLSATNTPHKKKFGMQTSKSNENVFVNDKKTVISMQNSSTLISKSGKANTFPKTSKLQEVPQNSSGNFSFEIEDLDDGMDDFGWKTYAPRGTKNNINRVSNKKNKAGNSPSRQLSVEDEDVLAEDSDNSKINEMTDMSEMPKPDIIGSEKRSSIASLNGGLISSSLTGSGCSGTSVGFQKKVKSEKEKFKARKDVRNCMVRRLERVAFVWAAHMISAITWLFKLITDVGTLSVTVGSTLAEDLYSWWINKALPTCIQQYQSLKENIYRFIRKSKEAVKWKIRFRRQSNDEESERKKSAEDLLAALGPERNIMLPTNGDDALKRLLSVRGQDPYCILGVRSDSSDETIRRYYKKQAVLVHPDKNLVPGAEEAFKILARAFELLGEPAKRQEYHQKLIEAHTKEQVYGEIGKLLEQLRKKMEIATGSIRCTKCNLRHKKNKTDRPLFAARYCAQCSIHHGAREGELWAERKGWFGLTWNYFACMDCHIWEINEWAKCQKKNLLHIKPDSHCVMYRLVAGNGNNQQSQQPAANCTSTTPDGHFHPNHDDDWDSLINNLCKSPGGVPGGKPGSHFYQQGKHSGGSCCSGTANPPASGTNRKRKGKRK